MRSKKSGEEQDMITQQHQSEDRIILSICDKELLGKKFHEGKKQLDINAFYDGEEKTEQETLAMITEETILNIVGKESIAFAIKHKFIHKEDVKTIQGVPHAQSF